MGTFIDHEYFCKGDKASVEKARKSIERFRMKNAKYSCNGNCDFSALPEVAADGMSLHYACYSTRGFDELFKSLGRLAKPGGLSLVHYIGCTDGTNTGLLCEIADGQFKAPHQFSADIGLRAAMAVVALMQGRDDAAFSALIERYSDSTHGGFIGEGWEAALADEDFEDDGDNAVLETNGVIAGFIGKSLSTYPELLASARIQKTLLKLRRSFAHTKGWMSKLALCEPSTNQRVDGLIACLESLEIGLAAKAPIRKSARRGEAREAVRI